jgi:hypothetical protein
MLRRKRRKEKKKTTIEALVRFVRLFWLLVGLGMPVLLVMAKRIFHQVLLDCLFWKVG